MFKYKFIAMILIIFMIAGCSEKSDKSNEVIPDVAEEHNDQNTIEEKKLTEKEINEIKSDALDKKISEMSIEEKTGQLIMCALRQNHTGNDILEINDDIKNFIKNYNIGGVILFGENIDTKEQTKKFIYDLQSESKIKLFMGIDEEGGRVSRLHASGKIDAYNVPSAKVIGEGGDTEVAFEMGKIIANEVKELGFNIDFAPIADINTNPKNTVIGDRAYGSDPESTADMVEKAVEGLQFEHGLYAVIKHFPGHGDTSTDSHTGEVVINHDLKRLEEVEFVPFKRLIDKGIDFVMVGHIKAPNVSNENLPSSMSKTMVTGILREKLGFDGIVVTDALNMGAIAQYYECGDVAVKAVNAGVDILLMPQNTEEAYNAVLRAVKEGTITEERINLSVKRILKAKCEAGIVEIDDYYINLSK